jgi:hypothetical protein
MSDLTVYLLESSDSKSVYRNFEVPRKTAKYETHVESAWI